MTQSETKFRKVMHEYKQGKLLSHGKPVTDQKQAVAIAFSEARKVNQDYGMNNGGKTDKKYIINVGETYDHSGGKAKVLRTYEEDGKSMVDYEFSNDKIAKPETQTLRAFIATIQGEYSKGGPIKNQYEGKTPEQVWNLWKPWQRRNLIVDHEALKPFMKEGNDVVDKKWDKLPDNVEGVYIKGVITQHVDSGQYAGGGNMPTSKLTPAKKQLQEKIAKLKKDQANIKAPAVREAMQRRINKLQARFDYNPSIKEKIAAQKGRFYLDVPTQYAKPLYRKLFSIGIKPELHNLNGKTKVVINHSKKLEKAYKIYFDILAEKNETVPPFSKIKGRL